MADLPLTPTQTELLAEWAAEDLPSWSYADLLTALHENKVELESPYPLREPLLAATLRAKQLMLAEMARRRAEKQMERGGRS